MLQQLLALQNTIKLLEHLQISPHTVNNPKLGFSNFCNIKIHNSPSYPTRSPYPVFLQQIQNFPNNLTKKLGFQIPFISLYQSPKTQIPNPLLHYRTSPMHTDLMGPIRLGWQRSSTEMGSWMERNDWVTSRNVYLNNFCPWLQFIQSSSFWFPYSY